MKFVVSVTEEDIKKGVQWESDNCPVARAVKRTLAEYKCFDISVGNNVEVTFNPPLESNLGCESLEVENKAIERFVDSFDSFSKKDLKDKDTEIRNEALKLQKAIKPFSFKMSLPNTWFPKVEKKAKKKSKK